MRTWEDDLKDLADKYESLGGKDMTTEEYITNFSSQERGYIAYILGKLTSDRVEGGKRFKVSVG